MLYYSSFVIIHYISFLSFITVLIEAIYVTGFWKTVPNHTFIIGYNYLLLATMNIELHVLRNFMVL